MIADDKERVLVRVKDSHGDTLEEVYIPVDTESVTIGYVVFDLTTVAPLQHGDTLEVSAPGIIE